MGNLNIVTGYTGSAHVTAGDDGSLNAGIFGEGSYVLNRGNKLAATATSSNSVTVADGDIIMQGRHIRINTGTTVTLSVDSGTAGMKRYDLIVCRYSRDASTNVESANLQVIKGTPSASSPADPEITSGDIFAGSDTIADFALYRISLDGINISLTALFTPVAYVPTTRKIAGLALSSDLTAAQMQTALSAYYSGGADVAVTDGGTGASTAAAARTNLGITPENIGAPRLQVVTGGSFNDIIVAGMYRTANVNSNTPLAQNAVGELIVSTGNGYSVSQVLFDVINGTGYFRTGDGDGTSISTWTDWKQLMTMSNNVFGEALGVTGMLYANGGIDLNGNLILDGSCYGTSLPASGVTGQLFFLRS